MNTRAKVVFREAEMAAARESVGERFRLVRRREGWDCSAERGETR